MPMGVHQRSNPGECTPSQSIALKGWEQQKSGMFSSPHPSSFCSWHRKVAGTTANWKGFSHRDSNAKGGWAYVNIPAHQHKPCHCVTWCLSRRPYKAHSWRCSQRSAPWGHCLRAVWMRSAFSSFVLSPLSSPPQHLSYRVQSENGSRVPEDLIYFTWLSVSIGSGAGNCHLPIISTKGMLWGRVSVDGLTSEWALQGLPDGGSHTHAPLTLTITAAGRAAGLIQPPHSGESSSLTWFRSASYQVAEAGFEPRNYLPTTCLSLPHNSTSLSLSLYTYR